jgi:competence protein ComEC
VDALGHIPFLRPALALCAGIGCSLYLLDDLWPGVFWLPVAAFALAIVSYLLWRRSLFFNRAASGTMLLLAVFALGFSLAYFARVPFSKGFFARDNGVQYTALKLVLDEEISAKANSWRCRARVISATDSQGATWKVNGYLLVYWPHRSNPLKPSLNYGDVLWVQNKAIPMPSAAFPGDFDFKAVMRYKNVQHQLFLNQGTWVVLNNEGNTLQKAANYCRNALVSRLHKILPATEAGLMASLMIGFRDELNPEDLSAFAVSGTTHVLAVSGLHVGLLYLLLVLLFTGKRRTNKVKRWQGATIILVLWGFALITGLSASVVRAALMFTILETGRSMVARRGNLLNSLFAAAFVQLLIDPLSLIDAGFQLSYLAVLGIAVIHPHLSNLWVPKSKLLYYAYQSATLSIAATVTTLPVTLYYFHSFPTWFIPANLWIVPLSTVAILAGLISVSFAWIPFVGVLLAKCATLLTSLLIGSAHFFARLPAASVKNILLSDLETLLIAMLILGLVGFAIAKKRVYAGLVAVSCLALAISGFYGHYRISRSSEVIVCEMRGELILAQREGSVLHIYSRPIPQKKADSLYGFMKFFVLDRQVSRAYWSMDQFPGSAISYDADGNGNFCYKEKNWFLAWHPGRNPSSALNKALIVQQKNVRFWGSQKKPEIVLRNNFRKLL